jgi:hypothetical protein
MRLIFSLLSMSLVLALCGPARADTRVPLNPAEIWRTARTNYRDGRFYAIDNSQHATWQGALRRSVAPVDMRANVHGAWLKNRNPYKLAGALIDPLQIEFTRQITSGQGLDWMKLARSMHPVTIGSTLVGGTAGDMAGAVVQSSLARLGPIGAAAGFFARPAMAFAGQIIGMNVGDSLWRGDKTFRGSFAQALRELKPGRDTGLLVGGVVGSTLGQALIPVPVIGGIIGGMVGSLVGGAIASGLTNVWPFSALDRLMRRGLGKLANWIDDSKKASPASPTSASSSTPPAPAAADATAVSLPRPLPERAFRVPLDDGPSMDDLPLATR